jgi:hypothetical protein
MARYSIDDFLRLNDNEYMDWDNAYGAQCVDLFNFYNDQVVGAPWIGTPLTGGAADLWTNFDNSVARDHYVRVGNSPDFVPQRGDVMIWAANTPATGPAGHVGICTGEGNTDYFVSFDQNYPTGTPCHNERHTYTGVYGVLRPKMFINNQPTQGGDTSVVKVAPGDDWKARFQRLHQQFLNRPLSDEVFRAIVGASAWGVVESWSDHPESQQAINDATLGKLAREDNWQGQIYTLQAQLAEAEKKLAECQASKVEPPVSPLPPVIDVVPPTKPEEKPPVGVVTPPPVQPVPTKQAFWSTTLGRTIVSVVVSLIGVAVVSLQGFSSQDATITAVVAVVVTVLLAARDLLNKNIANLPK